MSEGQCTCRLEAVGAPKLMQMFRDNTKCGKSGLDVINKQWHHKFSKNMLHNSNINIIILLLNQVILSYLYTNGECVRACVCVLLIFSQGSRNRRKLIFAIKGTLIPQIQKIASPSPLTCVVPLECLYPPFVILGISRRISLL